jgi:T4 RnlA family RNA ligase
MSLLNYLTKYFPNGSIGSFEGVSVDLKEHFIDKFGVNVKIEGNLYLFKYDQLLAKFSLPLVHEARGHIYQNSNGKWIRVANAMDKFFNYNEGYSPFFHEKDFQSYINQIELQTKEDGSLIHLYWLEDKKEWKVSTSGTITPLTIQDGNITFTELFWSTLGKEKTEFTSKLNKEYTYIFELCSKLNRVVTVYNTDRIYLLNIRHTEHGTYVPVKDVAHELDIAIPKSTFLYELNIKTLNELVMWVESHCVDDVDSKNKEGYVGYINGTPAAKFKAARYRFLHSFQGNNQNETRNNIIEAFFTDSIDDVYNDLHESSKQFVESLRIKVLALISKANSTIVEMKSLSFPTQKDYALYVLAHAPKEISGFFFGNKEKILAGEPVSELFTFWIKQNYKKFENLWKDIK